jgi:hypothetical protein
MNGHFHEPAALPLKVCSPILCVGRCVDHKASLDVVEEDTELRPLLDIFSCVDSDIGNTVGASKEAQFCLH